MSQGAFVGRQPIVNRDQHVVAYELLYRSSRQAQAADFEEQGQAALRVIVNTFASLGMDAVLGESQGFFNVTRSVFLSDAIEALPRDRVVIEILENVEADEEVIERCHALKSAGFRIAVDDWVVDDPRHDLLPLIDLVKIDLPAVPKKELRKLVRELREHDVELLAEKVETHQEFETCHKLGFHYFQGYFFAKPIVLEGADLDSAQTTLIRLLQQITAEASVEEIVDTFKQDAKLGLNVLRLVNTAGFSTRVKLEAIEDAVRHLGLQQLSRWVSILLYARNGGQDLSSPLLTTAAHRGRLMELITSRQSDGQAGRIESERAFLVGMLSLADALLGRDLADLTEELCLSEEISQPLVNRSGRLGELLSLTESVERSQVDVFGSRLEGWDLDLDRLQDLDHKAYRWVHGLIAPDTGDDASA